MHTVIRSYVGQSSQLEEIFRKICQLHELALSDTPGSAALAKRLLPPLLEQYELYSKLSSPIEQQGSYAAS